MIIGIDLGTTNSLAACFTQNGPQIIPNRLGKPLTPSAVSVDEEGTVYVGAVSYTHLDVYKRQGQACDTYNETAGKEAVKMESAEVSEGTATVVMTYDSTQSYSDFNRQALFAGTVKDAFKAGYDLNVTLFPVKEGEEPIGKDELLSMGEKKIAIVREAVDVTVWGKIRYLSRCV